MSSMFLTLSGRSDGGRSLKWTLPSGHQVNESEGLVRFVLQMIPHDFIIFAFQEFAQRIFVKLLF